MIPPIHREPDRNPRIAGVLRSLTTDGPGGDELLVGRIVQAARPRLAELRRAPRPWWEWTASWARIALPLGVAASLAAGLLLGRADLGGDTALTESALVLGLDDGSGTALAAELLPQPTDEWLLTEALDR